MYSILITGCNRGIGLGLVKKLTSLTKKPELIIATCRDQDKAKELRNVAAKNNNIHILELDLKNFDSYNDFAENVSKLVGQNGLNVLFNNAGISSKFTRLNLLKLDQINEALAINTVAPIMLTKALIPLLKRAAENNSGARMGVQKAVIVNMSSILGSLENNKDGGFYPYRCSKAALNMATRSMANDFKKEQILAIGLHPGWVKTDMGGKNALLEVEKSTDDIVKLLYSLNETHNGCFLQHDGKKIEW